MAGILTDPAGNPTQASDLNAQADQANQDIMHSLNASLQQDPRVQQWIANNGGAVTDANQAAYKAFVQSLGYSIPANLSVVNKDGTVAPENHDLRNALMIAAVGSPLVASLVSDAVGGAAGAAGAGAASSGATDVGASGGVLGATGGGAGVLPSTTIGTGAIGPITGGTGLSGATGGGIVGPILSTAKNLSPVLGNAAGAQSSAEANQALLDLQAAKTNAALPGQRLSTAARAAILSGLTPVSAQWGGPGSGLKGQPLKFTGGANIAALPGQLKGMTDAVQADLLKQQLAGPINAKVGQSTGDKVLGGAALGTGILGAVSPILKMFGIG